MLSEDHVIGKLQDERFQIMSYDYDAEQRQLKDDVAQMEADIAKGEEITADFQEFLKNVREYTDISELTQTVLNEFIRRIEVHAPNKTNGKRTQQIEIYYNAVGVINIPTDEEIKAKLAARNAEQQQEETNT